VTITASAPSYADFFVPGQARDASQVSSVAGREGKGIALVVSDVKEGVPAPVLLRATKRVAGCLNVAGATSVKTQEERLRMFNLVVRLFGGDPSLPFRLNRISIGSGGTRVLDGSNTLTGSMTAVETPGLAYIIAKLYSDDPADWPLTWGHAPRTNETLGYGGEHSSFQLAEEMDKNTIPNPVIHMLWLLQQGASVPSGWNGDIFMKGELLRDYRDSGQGESGELILSGGGVTAEEVLIALRHELPVLGAYGLGRASNDLVLLKDRRVDQIAEEGIRNHYQTVLDEGLNLELVSIFDMDRPRDGQVWMQDNGYGVIL
jgi:hypothetical protein